jgi:hypothetical protein
LAADVTHDPPGPELLVGVDDGLATGGVVPEPVGDDEPVVVGEGLAVACDPVDDGEALAACSARWLADDGGAPMVASLGLAMMLAPSGIDPPVVRAELHPASAATDSTASEMSSRLCRRPPPDIALASLSIPLPYPSRLGNWSCGPLRKYLRWPLQGMGDFAASIAPRSATWRSSSGIRDEA